MNRRSFFGAMAGVPMAIAAPVPDGEPSIPYSLKHMGEAWRRGITGPGGYQMLTGCTVYSFGNDLYHAGTCDRVQPGVVRDFYARFLQGGY